MVVEDQFAASSDLSEIKMYLFIIFFTLFFYWLYQRTRKPKKFPPGPPRLPVLGSLPFIGVKGSFVQTMKYAADKYGPVSGIFLGNIPAVIISDYSIIKGELDATEILSDTFMPILDTALNVTFGDTCVTPL